MDIATTVLAIQGGAALITIILFFIKPFRQWFFNAKKQRRKTEKEEAAERESVRCLLRSEIVRIYYANRERRALYSFEYENVVKLYEAYKEMGGNSFVDRIWDEIQDWEILP